MVFSNEKNSVAASVNYFTFYENVHAEREEDVIDL